MRYTGANSLLQIPTGRFDSHAHVFLASLPMAAARRYTPQYDASPEKYFTLLKQHGLDGALLVQPSFLGSDNSYLLKVLAESQQRDTLTLRAVVVLDPTAPVNLAQLQEWSDLGVIGIRLNFLGSEQRFDYRDWAHILSEAEKLGWHVELHGSAKFMPMLLPKLVKKHAKVVIDHLGLVGENLACEGLRCILDQPEDQIWIKVSALYRNFPGDGQKDRLEKSEPLRRLYADHFGNDRLIWGSDWPFTQHEEHVSYEDALDLIV